MASAQRKADSTGACFSISSISGFTCTFVRSFGIEFVFQSKFSHFPLLYVLRIYSLRCMGLAPGIFENSLNFNYC